MRFISIAHCVLAGMLASAASTASAQEVQLSSSANAQAAAESLIAAMVIANKRADGSPDVSPFLASFELTLLQEFMASVPAPATQPAIQDATVCTTAQTCPAGAAVAATTQTAKQNGATTGATGSTSATEKPGIPMLLGIAVENGAITNNVSGNTMTLSSTLYGLIAGFRGDTSELYKKCSHCSQLGASATFNLTSPTDPLQQASRRQISQWQVKYTFRDTSERSPGAKNLYNTILRPAVQKLANAKSSQALVSTYSLLDRDLSDASSTAAFKTAAADIDALRSGDQPLVLTIDQKNTIATKLLKALEQDTNLIKDLKQAAANAAVADKLALYTNAMKTVALENKDFLKQVAALANGWNSAVTFAQQYPPTTTTASTGTVNTPTYLAQGLIVTYKASSTAAVPSLTFNQGASFYPNPVVSANEQTFRGATAALQLEWSLGSGPFISDPLDKSHTTLSLNGNYSRLQENQHQPIKKADIALGNLKLEIPLPGGISLPLSFTVANSSEQVKETYVRGNFGLSFDLDKLAALLQVKK